MPAAASMALDDNPTILNADSLHPNSSQNRQKEAADIIYKAEERNENNPSHYSQVDYKGEGHIPASHHLPKPEAPPNAHPPPENTITTTSLSNSNSIGEYLRHRTHSLSSAILKKISSLKDHQQELEEDDSSPITLFNLSGLKVVVNPIPNPDQPLKGRITFFSRSNCRDCKAVRSFFTQKGFKFVEINIDVFPLRQNDLFQRTGTHSVPQIFFNHNHFGGLLALNSLRNSGEFDHRIKDMLATKCPDDAPAPPVYGFDDPVLEEEPMDEVIDMVRFLRQRLPIQDRLIKMKIVKNCFAATEMLDLLIHRLNCGRPKAVEIGRQMAQKLFIHHVFGENEFEEGNHYYRFLEHGPFIPQCFNFGGGVNDKEPKPAAVVGARLAKLMWAILESYASEDRQDVDYVAISKSEEFRRYINLIQELQRVNVMELSREEKLAFFLNMYNGMVIHGLIRFGRPEGVLDRKAFFSDLQYLVGGQCYSLVVIKNGILRGNRRAPYSVGKPLGSSVDKRLEVSNSMGKLNPLIHFGLCNGTKSSPTVRFYTPQGVEAELRSAAREFFQTGTKGLHIDLDKRTLYLSGMIKWFAVDFQNPNPNNTNTGADHKHFLVNWLLSYLDPNQAGLLTHLLRDGGPLNIAYQPYNWSLNSSSLLP